MRAMPSPFRAKITLTGLSEFLGPLLFAPLTKLLHDLFEQTRFRAPKYNQRKRFTKASLQYKYVLFRR